MTGKSFLLALALTGAVSAQPVRWEGWSPEVFERAKREKRFVLLEMEAVWCHWCHVMEETTYQVTGEKKWLDLCNQAAVFIASRFQQSQRAGLATAVVSTPLDRLTYVRDENVEAARFFNLLWHYTQQAEHKRLRDQALAYLANPEVALEFNTGGVLLADLESRTEPIHFTLGGKAAEGLKSGLLDYPGYYRMITREAQPAGVLVCDDRGMCAGPFREAPELAKFLAKLLQPAAH